MKHLITLTILILLTSLNACQRPDYPQTLRQAESVMNARPDSALHLLQGMADSITTLSEEAQMYYHLLTIQAKDKQYITHTSDSLINRIVSFYEDYGDEERLMMAYFYQGSVYRDMNDAPRALKAFHHAIDAGKKAKNLILLGQVYGQMGNLLAKHKLYDEALEVYQVCLKHYQKENDDKRIPLAIRNVARMYNAKEMNDSAVFFYRKAYQMAIEKGDERSRASIASELGCLFYLTNNIKEAKSLLYPLAFNLQKKDNVLLYLGLIYKASNNNDSAQYFIEQVLKSKDISKQSVAHQHLSQIVKEAGNMNAAAYHHLQYQVLQDSILAMTKTAEVENHHLTYNYERLKKAYSELKQTKTNILNYILIGLLVAAFITTTFVLMHRKKMRNHTDLTAVCQHLIFLSFRNAGHNEGKVTETDWRELYKVMNQELPEFTKKLSVLAQKYKLSQQEVRICYLLKLSFTNLSISNILHVSKSAITRAQGRLYKKITGEKENASKMRHFIEDL